MGQPKLICNFLNMPFGAVQSYRVTLNPKWLYKVTTQIKGFTLFIPSAADIYNWAQLNSYISNYERWDYQYFHLLLRLSLGPLYKDAWFELFRIFDIYVSDIIKFSKSNVTVAVYFSFFL